MKLLKSTLVASALILGTASMAVAQDKSYGSGAKAAKKAATDKAKDVMMEKAEDAMMEKGEAMMKDKAKSYGSGAKTEDAMMEKGDAMMKDKAKSYGSGAKTEDVMMKEGETMMKEKANSYGSGAKTEDVMMKEKMMKEGTIKSSPSYGSGAAPAPAAAIRCPAGTTAQADGTCMITGNYVPRS